MPNTLLYYNEEKWQIFILKSTILVSILKLFVVGVNPADKYCPAHGGTRTGSTTGCGAPVKPLKFCEQ